MQRNGASTERASWISQPKTSRFVKSESAKNRCWTGPPQQRRNSKWERIQQEEKNNLFFEASQDVKSKLDVDFNS